MTTPVMTLNVLIACEESQAECMAFRKLGHNAFSCDVQPCRKGGNADWHIQADVTPYLEGQTSFVTQSGISYKVPSWDLIICHPPCTYLCKVGSPHLYKDANHYYWFNGSLLHLNHERFLKMREAQTFFLKCLNAKAPFVAVENPIPMRLAELPKASTYADPSWFGVKYTKKTLYWLRNLPPLMAEYVHSNPKQYVRSSRGKYRSRTFPQMADAIARQWSAYVIEHIELRNKKTNYSLTTR